MLYTPFLLCLTLVAAQDATQAPKADAVLGAVTSQGCFNSLPDGTSSHEMTFAASGACGELCIKEKKAVAILHRNKCYCADTYPTESSLVDDDKCDYSCPGYAREACGGDKAYSVFNTGLKVNVEHDDGPVSSASTSASASASATEASTTSAAATSTASGTTTPTSSDASSTIVSGTTQSTPSSSTATSGAHRFSTPFGKFAKMIHVFFN
ncbi:hypothetical protein B0T10DRAFT_158560 [Thelonectria olida]|uniref:WSC domain-containing protein n=1 Tax=Thelonectria olida TaxID=1576542 RepID=A0A9P8VV11_9HYPO|nr:hypothetical protein B0T10DRAFT_158560 [Thelonectria olida]